MQNKIHVTDVHQKATAEANAKVPDFVMLGTPAHDKWLSAFDAAFMRISLKGE